MGFKVLIPQDVPNESKQCLLDRGYEIKMGTGITVEALVKDVEDCDAILARTAPFTEEVMKAGKKLKVISRFGVGVDNIDLKAAEKLGIWVCNAPLSNINSVAEHTIGLIIACARNMVRSNKEFREGNFEIRNQLTGMELEGKTLGLVGLGRIGTLTARKAIFGLDMKVIGYDPYVQKDKVMPEIELTRDWEYVFKNSDFISMHLPVTPETRKIMGKKEFELMKSSAYFINCARGEVVDETALIEALQQNKIAGAALDVFESEPPIKGSLLYSLENAIITPHNAALTKEAYMRMGLHAAMGIEEVLSGKKPTWPVNKPLCG